MARLPQVQVVHASEAKATPRRARKPQHTFLVNSRPYEITPFMLAPVLPGETLTNLLMQSRCVSDPVLNKLIGWWKEYYFFYVPLLAMCNEHVVSGSGFGTFGRADIDAMVLDPAATAITTNSALAADDVAYHSFKIGIPYLKAAVKAITGEYFRDEDDTALTAIDKYPGAYIDRQNGFQSLLADNAAGDDIELPGVDDLEELNILPTLTTEYAKWEIMRDNGMTDLGYDDYIRAQGVSVGRDEDHQTYQLGFSGHERIRPELVRFVRKWTYPTNHVEPTTGTPTSALAWSIAERADKRRFFKQPGFLVGITVTRPKIYLSSQKGNLAELFRNYKGFPSMVLKDHPYSTLQKEVHSATDSVLRNQATQDYWLDLADIYRYGDQFVNIAHAVADTHGLAFPADVAGGATNADRVPTLAQVKSFFVDAAGTKNFIREDGVVHLDIQTRAIGRDTTVGGG